MSGSSSSSAIIPYLKQWLALLVQEGKSAKTVNAYRRAVHHFVQWHRLSYGESFTPEQVIERDMRDWQSYQRRVTKNAPATINQRATGVRAYFHYLNEHHGLSRDPTTALQPVTKAKQQPQSLTRKQLRRLLKAVHQGGDGEYRYHRTAGRQRTTGWRTARPANWRCRDRAAVRLGDGT